MRSQIYAQALDGNVCLLGWEHLVILLANRIEETETVSLDWLWNISAELSGVVTIKDKEKQSNFHELGNNIIRKQLDLSEEDFDSYFDQCRKLTIQRGKEEIVFWQKEIRKIKNYTRKQAIDELIKSTKISNKIIVIEKYIESLGGY